MLIMNNLSENKIDKPVRFTFEKSERLCSKKTIDKLFAEGQSVFSFPLKIVYLETGNLAKVPVQAGFAVSKKNFKRAVRRNLLKRRMREAFRLTKHEFYESVNNIELAVFFVFTAKEEVDYAEIESAMKKGLKKLAREIHRNPNKKATDSPVQ